jgi:Tfp pilus assembly protein PilX
MTKQASETLVRRNRPRGSMRLPRRDGQQGIALVLSILLLSLISALGMGLVLSLGSDMMINGYYRNYRGAFYAADSGLNIARAQLGSQAIGQVPTTAQAFFPAPPIANTNTAVTNILNNLNQNYGNFGSLNTGSASDAWPENFQIASAGNCALSLALAPGYPVVTAVNGNGQNTAYKYIFNYNLCSVGTTQNSQQVVTSESGSISLDVQAQTTTGTAKTVSFAAFGAFVNNYPGCLGALIPGTMTGPMFTNGAWEFMTGGSYIFTDPVGQAQQNADYWFGGTCVPANANKYTKNGTTIAPTFQQGFNRSQSPVAQPPNSYSQRWAALDGIGTGETNANPANSDLNAHLKNIAGTSYPVGGAASGVYLPYTSLSGTNTLIGGGIYVEGSASIVLSVGTDGSGNKTQIYTITNNGSSTTITTNTAANTTTVVSGGTTLNLAGVPTNCSNVSPAPAQCTAGLAGSSPATMLFVNGTITGLKGTAQGAAAVQDGTQLTIAAAGDVDITGDVLYKTEPVTTSQNQIVPGTNPACCNGSPVATLIPGHDSNQVLGIFTSAGNIQLSSPYANQNLQVDGSLAAIGSACAANKCGFTVSGSINTFNNVGGQIQTNIFAANMQTENTYFDRRFTSRNDGFAPPWFPSTSINTIDITNGAPPLVTTATQRISWSTSPQ